MEEQLAPRVTALIVVHDGREALRRCLQSLEASTERERLEILVIDDGSHDNTASVFDDFPDVVSLKLPKRFGYVRASNIGLRTAKGELIFLLPPWFEVEPDTVARLANRLEASGDVGAVVPQTHRVWPFPSIAALQNAWKTGELSGARAPAGGEESVDYPRESPVMVRRELLRAMHFLDERFGDRWADLEMCSRIRDGGKTIVVMSGVAVKRSTPPVTDVDPMEWADSANGVATWVGLHHGWFAGLRARIGMAFYALGRGKTSVFTGILTGNKIDGNQ